MDPLDRITLNVGGVHYETTRTTLRARPSAYFATIPDDAEQAFIDRDGYIFSYILSYLRNGRIVFDVTDPVLSELLQLEADFFGMPRLSAAIARAACAQGSGDPGERQ